MANRKLLHRASATAAFVVLVAGASAARAQDAPAPRVSVSGAVNVNTKGISQVPALTLGRPAAIFDLAVRRGKFGFEPQFRFGLDGKPWSFLLWGRYRAIEGDRFRLTLGGHPSFSFRTTEGVIADTPRDFIEVRRYLAAEVTPTFVLRPDVSVGAYYLYSRGIDVGASRHTHLVAGRATVTATEVFGDFRLQLVPQVYFLRTSERNGTYVNTSASLGRPDWPWSVGTIVNKPIHSEVVGGQDFLWNVSLTYAFR